MTRASSFDDVNSSSKEDVPYIDRVEAINKLLRHVPEFFVGTVTGAGGAGGTLTLPFEPAVVAAFDTTAMSEVAQLKLPGGGDQINLVDGTAATTDIADAVESGGSWILTIPTQIAADTVTVQVLCVGFKDIAGSL